MTAPNEVVDVSNSMPKKGFTRRDFLKTAAILGLDLLVLGVTGVDYVKNIEPAWLEVTNLHLKLPRLPKAFSGFRLVQISDIHLGPWMTAEKFGAILQLAAKQKPDLIALTGDFVLTTTFYMPQIPGWLADAAPLLSRLAQDFSVVSVLGNHDYWYNAEDVRQTLERCGITVLSNSFMTLERGGEQWHIAGVDDIYEGRDDLPALLAKLPAQGGAMLLAHEPDFADQSAASGRFDLQISGHSHGGQVILPFIGPPVLPRLGEKYPLGLYCVGEMFQYTTRGVGMTLPPLRFNCRPELTVFTLEPA